jgi:hypothetical protein
MPTPPPQKDKAAGGGSLLTKKFGPLPAWGWIAVAVVGYLLYKKLTGSTATSTTGTASTGTAEPTASVTLPGGYSYSGPASGAAAFQQGVGASASPGNPGTTAVSPGNTGTAAFTNISAPAAQAYIASGQQVYYGVPGQPGAYLPISTGGPNQIYYQGSAPGASPVPPGSPLAVHS